MSAIAGWFARLFARPAGAVVAEGPRPQPAQDLRTSPIVPVLAVGDPDWPAILRAAGFAQADLWAGHIAGPARRFGITAGKRAAAFAATIGHESLGGSILVESLNYSPAGLRATWPARFPAADAERMGRLEDGGGRVLRPADQRAIAERAYGGRMGNAAEGAGDGWSYRGRGLIQITGRNAYSQAGDALGLPLVQHPDLAVQPNCAAGIACWAWAEWKGCNALADAGDVEG